MCLFECVTVSNTGGRGGGGVSRLVESSFGTPC